MTKAELLSKIDRTTKNSVLTDAQKKQLLANYNKQLAELDKVKAPTVKAKPKAKSKAKVATTKKVKQVVAKEAPKKETSSYDYQSIITKAEQKKAKSKSAKAIKKTEIDRKENTINKKLAKKHHTTILKVKRDRKVLALPRGKRISENGNVYYENRLDHSDINRKVKYEDGGVVFDYTKNLGLVDVKFEDAKYNYSTNVSGSISEKDVKKYFVGKPFNLGSGDKDNVQICTDVVFHEKGTY